jgi:hypothetical protein
VLPDKAVHYYNQDIWADDIPYQTGSLASSPIETNLYFITIYREHLFIIVLFYQIAWQITFLNHN